MTAAHGAAGPTGLWSGWGVDPVLAVVVAASALVFARGVRTLRRDRRQPDRWRIVAFVAALILLLVGLSEPADAIANDLFAAHMAQHLWLIIVVAPLLVFAQPFEALRFGLPGRGGSLRGTGTGALVSGLGHPVVATALHLGVVWAWHLPVLYELALANDELHALEHGSFLVTAAIFWHAVLLPGVVGNRLRYGTSMLCVFVVGLGAGALGALLTFAARPLYDAHRAGVAEWGTTLVADQRWAGLVMWVPAGAVYLVTIATLFLAWMRALDEHMHGVEGGHPSRAAPERAGG